MISSFAGALFFVLAAPVFSAVDLSWDGMLPVRGATLPLSRIEVEPIRGSAFREQSKRRKPLFEAKGEVAGSETYMELMQRPSRISLDVEVRGTFPVSGGGLSGEAAVSGIIRVAGRINGEISGCGKISGTAEVKDAAGQKRALPVSGNACLSGTAEEPMPGLGMWLIDVAGEATVAYWGK